MTPIFVPTAADLAALALLILAGALLMLAAWVVADWVMAMFDAMEGSDEAPTQPHRLTPLSLLGIALWATTWYIAGRIVFGN